MPEVYPRNSLYIGIKHIKCQLFSAVFRKGSCIFFNFVIILNKSITYILSELLANTSNPNFISYTTPTSYVISNKLTRKYAIKTGTTEYDHLVFGYNKDVIVGLWAGYDDNRQLENNDATNNKNMWADIIERYLSGKEDNWFTMPNNVVGVLANPLTGEIATKEDKNSVILYYLKGTEPSYNQNLDDDVPTIKYEE